MLLFIYRHRCRLLYFVDVRVLWTRKQKRNIQKGKGIVYSLDGLEIFFSLKKKQENRRIIYVILRNPHTPSSKLEFWRTKKIEKLNKVWCLKSVKCLFCHETHITTRVNDKNSKPMSSQNKIREKRMKKHRKTKKTLRFFNGYQVKKRRRN